MSEFYVEKWQEGLKEFREMTKKFYQKEITVNEYKGFSGGFGSYAQKGGENGMLRLRFCGGRITKEKLRFISEMIQKYKINKIHFTTCQSIQLHNLKGEDIADLMEQAWEHDIITLGGGGDYPRNIVVSPLSGVEKEEYFDVLPYAEAANDYMVSLIKTIKLPRKLKVAFSNSKINASHATFRDLGFVATKQHTFDVYSAGGLGNHPKMGILTEENIQPEKILYYIKAMINTFMAHGNYENRAKARTRYMQDTLGVAGYKKAYLENLSHVLETEKLDLNISYTEFTKQTFDTQEIEDKKAFSSLLNHSRIISQKQHGLYTVSYHPFGGNIAPDKLLEISDCIKDMEGVELRIAPDESLYLIHCTAKEAKILTAITSDGANTPFEASVSCIGNQICQIGVRDSQKLLASLLEKVGKEHFSDGTLPKIHISGCPSSCGTHQIGAIGFRGGVKMIDKIPYSAFQLHINGSESVAEERFGEDIGIILEEDIPIFLIDLGKTIQAEQMTFDVWLTHHLEDLKEIAHKYIK